MVFPKLSGYITITLPFASWAIATQGLQFWNTLKLPLPYVSVYMFPQPQILYPHIYPRLTSPVIQILTKQNFYNDGFPVYSTYPSPAIFSTHLVS